MMSRFKMSVFFVFAMTTIVTLFMCLDFTYFSQMPLAPKLQKPMTFQLTVGTPMRTLAFDLAKQGLVQRPRYLSWMAYWQGITRRLQAGEYAFHPRMTAAQLLEKLQTGDVVRYKFTIVEGWTFKQLWHALQSNPKIHCGEDSPYSIMKAFGKVGASPEAEFFPDTYFFTDKPNNVLGLLKQAHDRKTQLFNEMWIQRDKSLPYRKLDEAVIVASMIEKETALPEERPMIAAVIINRLRQRIPLQIDPTVIYGLGEHYTPPLDKNQLKIDTPYNTYMHYGLPPTPIAFPSLNSLYAALHPAHVNYLYFVSKGDGSHQFSEKLVEQNNAVSKYILKKTKPEKPIVASEPKKVVSQAKPKKRVMTEVHQPLKKTHLKLDRIKEPKKTGQQSKPAQNQLVKKKVVVKPKPSVKEITVTKKTKSLHEPKLLPKPTQVLTIKKPIHSIESVAEIVVAKPVEPVFRLVKKTKHSKGNAWPYL